MVMTKVLATKTETSRIVTASGVFPLVPGTEDWESSYKQSWVVTAEKTASGRRRTLANQSLPGIMYSLAFKGLSKAERDVLVGFYAQQKGAWGSFWYKDFSHHAAIGQILPKGSDGKYQCLIVDNNYVEPAEKVEVSKVYVDGEATTDYTESGGKLTVPEAGSGTVTADYEYYRRVAFNGDLIFKEAYTDCYNVSVKLEVVRE